VIHRRCQRERVLWFVDDVQRVLLSTVDAQLVLGYTDATPHVLWFTGVPFPDVSDARCGEEMVPLTTPSQQAVVPSGLMCVPPIVSL